MTSKSVGDVKSDHQTYKQSKKQNVNMKMFHILFRGMDNFVVFLKANTTLLANNIKYL